MLRDSFYTPQILADKLIGYIRKKSFKNAVDFCIGDGQLLRSAKSRWPQLKCFGSDISDEAIAETKANHPDWCLSRIDFLEPCERQNAEIFKIQPKYQLILLNPPFSCRGGTLHEIQFEGKHYTVSTSMRFLVTALDYLDRDGYLYAILPTSTAYSQKDQRLWNLLEKKYNLSILEEPRIKYFKGCTPNVILISLNDFSKVSKYSNITRLPFAFENLQVYRGKLSMNQVKQNQGQHFLVHSTNIRDNRLVNLNVKQTNSLSTVFGPAILIPRVGKPKQSKICMIGSGTTYVISDCIIALKTITVKDAQLLYRYIIENWELVEIMYKGTGAKYITVDKIKQFLNLDLLAEPIEIAKAI